MALTTRISLDALPFPVFEEERAELLRYKEEAIQKEREIKRRKHEELAQLRRFVELRLSEIQAKKQIEELQKQQGVLLRGAGSFSDGSASRQHKSSNSYNSSFSMHSHSPSPTVTSRTSPHTLQSQYRSSSPNARQLQSQYHSPSNVQQLQTQYQSMALNPQPQSYPHNVVRPPGPTRRRLTWTGTSSADLKWYKLTAMVKGFLTRRLLHSHKVQGLVKTIKDTSSVLQSLNDGSSSSFDVELYKRLDMQLQVARINLHKIFFESSVIDRMGYIAHTRVLREERAYKKPPTIPESHTSRAIVHHQPRQITGKLSSATKKSMERRKQRSMMMPGRTVNRKIKNTS